MNDLETLFNFLLDEYHNRMMKSPNPYNLEDATRLLSMAKVVFRLSLAEKARKEREYDD